MQDISLLCCSNFSSSLLPALPFIFLSEDHNYVPHGTLRSSLQPDGLRLTKQYYQPHIAEVSREFELVKDLGSGSLVEWMKGLEALGKDRLNDSAKWEHWEARGGLKKVNMRPHQKAIKAAKRSLPSAIEHGTLSRPESVIGPSGFVSSGPTPWITTSSATVLTLASGIDQSSGAVFT